MIAYAIEAAQNSGLFEHVIVSTDDEEIAAVAQNFSAETPFRRPPELADDYTATAPVVAHAIDSCQKLGWRIDLVCCIYPTVPFIEVEDLSKGLSLKEETNTSFSFPVAEFPSAIQRAMKRDDTGRLSPLQPELELARTQDLESTYYDAGQFYWGSKQAWLNNSRIHYDGVGLVIPSWRVVDIDTLDDWQRAEILYAALYKTK